MAPRQREMDNLQAAVHRIEDEVFKGPGHPMRVIGG
jgi:hypothetical protein